MKIKIIVNGQALIACPINPNVSSLPNNVNRPRERGKNGIPAGAGNRIRNAVNEILKPNFSTVLLDEMPDSSLLNRIRTHLGTDCVGVVEHGVKNGWHLHIVHNLPIHQADRILSNYGKVHSRKVDNKNKSAWYITKSIGTIPPIEHPVSWYFCSRHLGRSEVFYIDSTIAEVIKVGEWIIKDFYLISKLTITTLDYLKKLPPWIEP